ncbi:hypothetical protein [Phyllobacterium sp. K27]
MTVRPFNTAFRDFVTDGVPSSGLFKPEKRDLRDTFNNLFSLLTGANSGAIVRAAKAALDGDLSPTNNVMAWVITAPGEGNPAVDDGVYQKVGASGVGSWTKRGPLPYNIINLNNANLGTPDSIQVTTAIGLPSAAYGALYVLNITAANTGPVTVSVNGTTAKPVVTNVGDPIPAEYFTPGMAVICVDDGTSFRLLSYGDASAIQAAAEAAAAAAIAAAATVVIKDFATRDDVEVAEVNPAAQFVRTAGMDVPGDEGDALYIKVGSIPDHTGYVTDADGQHFAITKRTVRASQFGAFPSASVSSHQNFMDAINYLNEVGGGELIIDGNEEYLVGDRILPNIVTSDITLSNLGGGVLKAATGLTVPILDIRASSTAGTVTSRILRLHNMRYDASEGLTTGPGQACTALNTQYFEQVYEDGTYAHGGVLPANGHSDSGHTPTANIYTRISNSFYRGWGDNAIYATGDNSLGTVGDGYACEIINTDFELCQSAAQGKRELTLLKVTGGSVKLCTAGFGAPEVYPTGPGRTLEVEGVHFDRITANAAQFRATTKGYFKNNYVKDWGRTIDTDASVGANANALTIRGASRLQVSGNHFTRINWVLDDQRAISFDNLTLFPGQPEETVYTQGEHYFSDNIYSGLNRVYVEAAGGNPSVFEDEVYRNIPVGQIWNSTFNYAHTLTYAKVGSSRRYTRYGLEERVVPVIPDKIINAAANSTIIIDDSGSLYTNQGATTRVQFTLPAAAAGLCFKFINMDADGLRIRAGAGDVIRINGTPSTAAGYADSPATVGTSVELVAVDEVNWVAKSSSGTWTLA